MTRIAIAYRLARLYRKAGMTLSNSITKAWENSK